MLYQIHVNDTPIGKPMNWSNTQYWLRRIAKLFPDCDVHAHPLLNV